MGGKNDIVLPTLFSIHPYGIWMPYGDTILCIAIQYTKQYGCFVWVLSILYIVVLSSAWCMVI